MSSVPPTSDCSVERYTREGPSRIFIVRHGDRMDHEDKTWRADTTRPHDSPLSRRGHRNAHMLGRYLALKRHVGTAKAGASREDTDADGNTVFRCATSDIVVLASPLQRTVETAHNIICGILSVVGNVSVDEGASSPTAPSSPPPQQSVSSASAIDGSAPQLKKKSVGFGGKAYATAASDVDALLAELALDGIFIDDGESSKLVGIGAGGPSSSSSSSALQPITPPASLSSQAALVDGSSASLIPIFLEPGAIEGQYWLNTDLESGFKQGNGRVRLTAVSTHDVDAHAKNNASTLDGKDAAASVVALGAGEHKEQPPVTRDYGVYRGANFHREHVSPLVQLEGFACPRLEKKIGFGEVKFDFDNSKMAIVEHGPGVRERCKLTINNIANSPLLNGKTVIIVGHGETTKEMVSGLMYAPRTAGPIYTSFTEGVRFTEEELAEIAEMHSHNDGRKLAGKPAQWHRWKVVEGSVAMDAPHIRIAKRSLQY